MARKENQPFQEKLVGQTLQGRYVIEELAATGGMAWVFRAFDQHTRERKAVKILFPHIAEHQALRERFLDEAKFQASLTHPNIVRVFDLIEEESFLGLSLEWIQGQDLKSWFSAQNAALSLEQIFAISAPILSALAYTHDRGLVHRDIKPGNILLHHLGDQLLPKLLDFGIAKLVNQVGAARTATGMTMGTTRYISPEQIRDSKRVDHRADVYSLGITLFELATGQLPFEGRPEHQLYHHLNTEPPKPSIINPLITPDFESFLLTAIEKSPNARFQSCHEMLSYLDYLVQIQHQASSVTPQSIGGSELTKMISTIEFSNNVMLEVAGGQRSSPWPEQEEEKTLLSDHLEIPPEALSLPSSSLSSESFHETNSSSFLSFPQNHSLDSLSFVQPSEEQTTFDSLTVAHIHLNTLPKNPALLQQHTPYKQGYPSLEKPNSQETVCLEAQPNPSQTTNQTIFILLLVLFVLLLTTAIVFLFFR